MSLEQDRLFSGQKRRLRGKRPNMGSLKVNQTHTGRSVQDRCTGSHCPLTAVLVKDLEDTVHLKESRNKSTEHGLAGPRGPPDTVTSSEGANQQTWSLDTAGGDSYH